MAILTQKSLECAKYHLHSSWYSSYRLHAGFEKKMHCKKRYNNEEKTKCIMIGTRDIMMHMAILGMLEVEVAHAHHS